MTTEIYIESRKLDLTADISSLLTFAIDDVKDFSSRSTTFSKSIVLPGTANNNQIFGHIFETGISNEYNPAQPNIGLNFNPGISARCWVFQDALQTFKGTIRLIEIIRDKNSVQYEVALNGELTSLSVVLSSGYLSDLDFSEYNQPWDIDSITDSWETYGTGAGVYFPLIDYGNYSFDKHNWDFHTFRPALYVREYIVKMFEAANFRWLCPLFNTDRFRKLIIPHNQKTLTKFASEVLNAEMTVPYEWNRRPGTTRKSITWTAYTGGLFTTTDNQDFTYTSTDTISTNIDIAVNGEYTMTQNGSFNFTAEIRVLKNGVPYATIGTVTDPSTNAFGFFNFAQLVPITIAQNDNVEVEIYLTGGDFGDEAIFTLTDATMDIAAASGSIVSPLDYGEDIDMTRAIPQNIRQVDFLLSIVKLFNLYVYEDRFDERMIHISPFIDFYPGTAVDWTHKLNRDAPIRIKPLSELNSKIYQFDYRSDTDYWNDVYKKRYNQGYGSHVYDSEFEFASQTNKLELIFAATPLVGYVGEDKIYSTIFKRTGTDAIVEENIDSVIRILQIRVLAGMALWSITNDGSTIGSYNAYGYAGHFDDPNNPEDDLNFGVLKELFFTLTAGDLSNTQFNLYWSAYMAEITDRDSKMLQAKFYLTAKDIFELDFSKYVFVEGSLFRLNKITDYNASVPDDCSVELLKVVNTSYLFPPGSVPDDRLLIDFDDARIVDFDNAEINYR